MSTLTWPVAALPNGCHCQPPRIVISRDGAHRRRTRGSMAVMGAGTHTHMRARALSCLSSNEYNKVQSPGLPEPPAINFSHEYLSTRVLIRSLTAIGWQLPSLPSAVASFCAGLVFRYPVVLRPPSQLPCHGGNTAAAVVEQIPAPAHCRSVPICSSSGRVHKQV